jgi:hypothetical protein
MVGYRLFLLHGGGIGRRKGTALVGVVTLETNHYVRCKSLPVYNFKVGDADEREKPAAREITKEERTT